MGVLVLKPCEATALKDVLVGKMPVQYKRFRSKMVKVMDQYYFKELEGDELKSQLEKCFIIRNDVNTMDQLSALIGQEQNVTVPEEEL